VDSIDNEASHAVLSIVLQPLGYTCCSVGSTYIMETEFFSKNWNCVVLWCTSLLFSFVVHTSVCEKTG